MFSSIYINKATGMKQLNMILGIGAIAMAAIILGSFHFGWSNALAIEGYSQNVTNKTIMVHNSTSTANDNAMMHENLTNATNESAMMHGSAANATNESSMMHEHGTVNTTNATEAMMEEEHSMPVSIGGAPELGDGSRMALPFMANTDGSVTWQGAGYYMFDVSYGGVAGGTYFVNNRAFIGVYDQNLHYR